MSNNMPLLEAAETVKEPKQKSLNTQEVMALLRARHPKGEYAFFTEVANATGTHCKRHCDALAFSLWPSRGLTLTGFEVKVSRSDWVKELRDPAKAESVARFCDFWYVVVGNKTIVQLGELPATWGLMAPDKDKLKIITPAANLQPAPIDRNFIAALFRAAQEQIGPYHEIQKIRQEEYKRGRSEGKSEMQHKIDVLERTIKKFEDEAGVKLDYYDVGSLVDAMKLVKNGALGNVQYTMRMMRQQVAGIAEQLDKALDLQPTNDGE